MGMAAPNVNVTGVKFLVTEEMMARQDLKKRIRFLIYFVLACIMGSTWTAAFLAIFMDLHDMWYPFIILNGMQVGHTYSLPILITYNDCTPFIAHRESSFSSPLT